MIAANRSKPDAPYYLTSPFSHPGQTNMQNLKKLSGYSEGKYGDIFVPLALRQLRLSLGYPAPYCTSFVQLY